MGNEAEAELAAERERADRAERERDDAEALRNLAWSQRFEAENQRDTERAAAEALAKEAETVVRIVKEKWGSANEFPAFNRALAAYRATHQPATEVQP